MSDVRPLDARLILTVFVVVLAVAFVAYRPAFTGAFELDDVSNLGELANVEDADSLLDFTLSGKAGPTGRPVALLTFGLQAEQWEKGAAAFLQVNLFIHLLNALLLAGCLYQLARLVAVERNQALLVAVAASSLWVTMPLLASASLLVVQRMTTLSATFALVGLGGYLAARSRLGASPARALVGMSVSLVAGTVLATLSKESGLLLPALVLALEATVLRPPESVPVRRWRAWQAVFLIVPAVVVFAYVASRAHYPDWLVARRDFNAWERLLTEARVLWVYLGKALVGLPAKLGIYQTPPAISRSLLEPITLLAALAWIGLGAAALIWRRRYPLSALAVLWYLIAHVIESTVVPLELYFEHRNYLAVIGPLFAACMGLFVTMPELRKLAGAIIPVYLLVNVWFVFNFADVRGKPDLAANYWAIYYPDSVRAVTTLASQELEDWGPTTTLKTLDGFVSEYPQHGYLRIQALNLLCQARPDEDHSDVLASLYRELPDVDFTYTAGSMLSQLFTTVSNTSCRDVTTDTVKALAESLHANRRYKDDPLYNQFHHKLLAGIYRYEGDYAATVESLDKAIEFRPSPELHMMMVTLLGGAGQFDEARAFIDDALNAAPRHPLRATAWRRNLHNLREYIAELERYSQRESQPDPSTENDAS
mgnify:FL=1